MESIADDHAAIKKQPRMKNKLSDVPMYVRRHSDTFTDQYSDRAKARIDNHKASSKTKCNHKDTTSIETSTSISNKLCRCCKGLSSSAESRDSWYLLLFRIFPVNVLTGINFISFSMFYVEYVEHFKVNRFTAGMVIAIKAAVISIAGIFGSAILEPLSSRAVSMLGGAFICIGTLLNSFAVNVYMLFITQGLLEGLGFSLMMLNASVLIQSHFNKSRVLGRGLGMLGYSLGNLLGPGLITMLIEEYGWRGTMLIMAALYGNMVALSATFWQPSERPQRKFENCTETDADHLGFEECDVNAEPVNCKDICKDIFNFQYFKDTKFTLCCISASLARYNLKTFIEHGPSKIVSLGMSKRYAASVLSVFGVTTICVRIFTTIVGNTEKMNRLLFFAVGVFIGCAGSFLTLVHSLEGQVLAAVAHGIHTGLTNTIQSVVVVDIIGCEKLAGSMSLFNLVVQFVSLTAAPFGGYLYDVTHDYDIPHVVSGSLAVLGGVFVFSLGINLEIRRCKDKQKAAESSLTNLETSSNHSLETRSNHSLQSIRSTEIRSLREEGTNQSDSEFESC